MEQEQQTIRPAEFAILSNDVGEIKTAVSKMASALERLSLLEERHQTVAATLNKILERVERVEDKQHASDLSNAAASSLLGSVETMGKAVLEMHIEREKDKARLSTLLWTVRGLWAVLGSGGVYFLVKAVAQQALSS